MSDTSQAQPVDSPGPDDDVCDSGAFEFAFQAPPQPEPEEEPEP